MKNVSILFYVLLFSISIEVDGQDSETMMNDAYPASFSSGPPSSQKILTIGDKIPNLILSNVINAKAQQVNLSDLKGKALIIDFWAPWCSPCLKAFPKIDSIQKKFTDNISFLLITKERKEFSLRTLNNLKDKEFKNRMPLIFEDTVISKLFKFKVIPHYVWIDNNGIIKAITGANEITDRNIQNLITGNKLELPIKNDMTIQLSDDKPLFTDIGVPESDRLLYNSTITKYIQGLPTQSTQKKKWIRCTSHSISLLYKLAFGEFNLSFLNNNRLILEGFKTKSDSLLVGRYTSSTKDLWTELRYDNLYNYELLINDSLFVAKEKFKLMQQDLNRIFFTKGIQGKQEKRKIKMLALIRTSDNDALKSKGGTAVDDYSKYYLNLQNQPISSFVSKLQAFFSKEDALPIEDETGYTQRVDLRINANLTDINEVNTQLESYGLKLVKREKLMDMIIISKLY